MLRFILFLGLILHKVIWEVMKKRGSPNIHHRDDKLSLKSLVKFFKVMVLAFIIVQTLFLDIFPISNRPNVLRIIGTAIYFLGLAMAVIARVQLGGSWANIEDRQVLPQQRLVTKGIYRYIRHPIYAGDILLLVGLELALNSWLALGVIFIFVAVIKQVSTEEHLLAQTIPAYEVYSRQTKRFIPFIF